MKIIDISQKLDENAPVYEGDPTFSSEVWKNVQDDGFMLSILRMGTHTGTHRDMPPAILFQEGRRSPKFPREGAWANVLWWIMSMLLRAAIPACS